MARQIDVSDKWGKQVDGDRYVYPPPPPLSSLAERLIQDDIGEGAHQAVLAHQRQKLVRQHHSEYRMLPPGQCLRPHHVCGLQVDLRLVQHGQRTVTDGLAQVAQQPHLNQSAPRQLNIGCGESQCVVPEMSLVAEGLQTTAEAFCRSPCTVSQVES